MAFLLINPAEGSRTRFVLGDPLRRVFDPTAGGSPVVRLPAPAGLSVEVDEDSVIGSYTEVVGAASYERRYTGGAIIPYGIASGFEDTLADGAYTVKVRAVDALGVKGLWATSSSFTIDTVAPTVLSASISGTTLQVNRSEPCNGHTGYSLTGEHGAFVLTYSEGEGIDTEFFTLSRTPYIGEVVSFNYTPGNVEDAAGNAMEAFSGLSVTHSSTEPLPTADTRVTSTGDIRVTSAGDTRATA